MNYNILYMKNKLLKHDEMILEIFSKFDKKEDFKKIKGKSIDYHAILEDYIK